MQTAHITCWSHISSHFHVRVSSPTFSYCFVLFCNTEVRRTRKQTRCMRSINVFTIRKYYCVTVKSNRYYLLQKKMYTMWFYLVSLSRNIFQMRWHHSTMQLLLCSNWNILLQFHVGVLVTTFGPGVCPVGSWTVGDSVNLSCVTSSWWSSFLAGE